MKHSKLLTLSLIALTTVTLAGCFGKNTDNNENISNITAIEYNDQLVDLTSECLSSEEWIRNAYNDENASVEDIQLEINNSLNKCQSIRDQVNSLWSWEWDESLKNWVITIIENDIAYYQKFSQLVPYLRSEAPTDEEIEESTSILNELEALDENLENANNDLALIQDQFAKNHGFELEDQDQMINEEIAE